MLRPSQFKVNEAWIAFRLNEVPIETERDGDFNCFALMDAASCFILGIEMYPAQATELSQQESRRLLQQGHSHKGFMAKKLYVVGEHPSATLSQEASQAKIEVVAVAEGMLQLFIDEARDGFKDRFGKAQ